MSKSRNQGYYELPRSMDPHRSVRSTALKILMADHDRDVVDMLSFWLQGPGYDVVRAFDGEQVITRWHEALPDLVLLELHLSKRDGFASTNTTAREVNAEGQISTTRTTLSFG